MPAAVSAITVVIVCHDSADALAATLPALAGQLRDGDEVVLVDSGSSDGGPEAVAGLLPAARRVDAGGNVGFAAGCDLGAAHTTTELILLLNPDAVPAAGCLDALRGAAERHPGWGAWQALVTMADGAEVNTSGNLVHWLGFGWAGALGEPVAAVDPAEREVGFGSGAALVVRREAWEAAGGFNPEYFMYCEDLDLSLRLRLSGWGIGVVPSARADHDYSFTKGDYKWFFLERNRWWTILATYPAALLALALPGLLALEVALMLVAARDGWLRPKLRAQAAVLRTLPATLARRRRVQATRTITTRAFADGLTASLDSPVIAAASRSRVLRTAQSGFWRGVLAVIR
ncbi:glycosyltransferase [Baekduia sp. Peel2402]|uniref:glycosyltransferase n=1 Tax=Baekduia sp. Peel2402 TaxID=3458296 RepID=UPI00403E77ED